jgi:flagellar biosynthesis protein FlhB
MAEHDEDADRSEEPTQKKLEDAHKKGDVAKSQEVNTWFVLSGATLVLLIFAQGMAGGLAQSLGGVMANAHALPVDAGGVRELVWWLVRSVFAALSLPLLILVAAALAGNVVQHKLVWTTERMKPKLNKISPIKGFKRLFSAESLMNFAKGLAKLVIVSAVMFVITWPERERLAGFVSVDPEVLLVIIRDLALKLLAGVVAIMAIVAALDFMWQQHRWHKRQKMSMREIKDEHKQTEGDPLVRAKLRQVRMERSRRRMMAQVPDATVVVTNPTHYAVALKYEGGMNAPVCVAKGTDAVALKIREVADGHDIPIIENPPLARTLHAAVEVDEEIKPEHYKAVAEIIGHVMQIKARAGWRTNHGGRG